MSGHTHQSCLRIVPAHDLEQSALTSFRGARYHFDRLKSLLNRPALQTHWQDDPNLSSAERNLLQEQVNAFHWHIRAFFWELVGAFDGMLHWSNARFALGVKERDVRWETIADANAEAGPGIWAQKKSTLQSAWESEWFFEVRQYRNFAHRSFLLVQAEYAPPDDNPAGPHCLRLVHLLPARVGQHSCRNLIEHLSEYQEKMGKVGEDIFHA